MERDAAGSMIWGCAVGQYGTVIVDLAVASRILACIFRVRFNVARWLAVHRRGSWPSGGMRTRTLRSRRRMEVEGWA